MATQQRQPAESVRIQSVDRAVDLLLALAAAPPAAATMPSLSTSRRDSRGLVRAGEYPKRGGCRTMRTPSE